MASGSAEFCWDPASAYRSDLIDIARVAEKATPSGYVEGNILGQTPDFRRWVRQGIPRKSGYDVKRKNLARACRGAKSMMEIGFNAGFSAVILLSANPDAHLTIFDLGGHAYVRPCYAWIQGRFPGRTTLVLGDSTKTVPRFIKENPNAKFDFVHVDGGHTEAVATSDVRHSLRVLQPGGTIVVDDTQKKEVLAAMRKFPQLGDPTNDMSEFRHTTQNMIFLRLK